MKDLCLYCEDTLTFTSHGGWKHSNGNLYVGECLCETTAPHPYSHDAAGQLICRTWRDHHVATPRRSRQAVLS